MEKQHLETFWTLLQDPAHWCFEIFLMFLFDIILGLLIIPWFRRSMLHHKSDDARTEELEKQVSEMRKIMGLTNKKDNQ